MGWDGMDEPHGLCGQVESLHSRTLTPSQLLMPSSPSFPCNDGIGLTAFAFFRTTPNPIMGIHLYIHRDTTLHQRLHVQCATT